MEGISARSLNIYSFLILLWATSKILFVAAISIFIVWYVQYLWRRRKLYLHASKVPGPLSLPIIGSAIHFAGDPYGKLRFTILFHNVIFSCEFLDILKKFTKLFKTYPGICRVWLGPTLLYAISVPKYIEILLPNCLKKDLRYRHTEIVMGHGLFSAPSKL